MSGGVPAAPTYLRPYNVEVNRRAQRVRLNLVLGLRGVCSAYECAASDWRAMECENPRVRERQCVWNRRWE